MADIGPVWGTNILGHMTVMLQQFSELVSDSPKEGTVIKSIGYGDHPRQVFDVYQPLVMSARPAPIVMFVHGGGFVDGDKDCTSEVYSNVLWYFARHGIVGVNVEFRLAPEFKYPSGTQDIAAAIAKVRSCAELWGGDSERIYLMGHSAGATHAAHYAGDRRFHPEEGSGLAGLVIVSGRVRVENGPENPNASRIEAYYGTNTQTMIEGSPVTHITASDTPVMIAVAEYENPLIDLHCAEMFHGLTLANRRAPRFIWMAGHNHASIIAHFNTAEDTLGRQILDFIRYGR